MNDEKPPSIHRVTLKTPKVDYPKLVKLFTNVAIAWDKSAEITGEPIKELHFKIDRVITMGDELYDILKESDIGFQDYV
jgi:hypothetical protein